MKFSLDAIEINSFVTRLDSRMLGTIIGGMAGDDPQGDPSDVYRICGGGGGAGGAEEEIVT